MVMMLRPFCLFRALLVSASIIPAALSSLSQVAVSFQCMLLFHSLITVTSFNTSAPRRRLFLRLFTYRLPPRIFLTPFIVLHPSASPYRPFGPSLMMPAVILVC